jgi:prophage regulatory protein
MEQLLRLPKVLELTGLSRSELYRQVGAGRFPKPVPISERLRAWDHSEVQEWIRARRSERDRAAA